MNRGEFVVVLKHDEPTVSPTAVITLISNFVRTLKSVDMSTSEGGRQTARWRISDIHMSSPFQATFTPAAIADGRPVDRISGFAAMELGRLERGEQPLYLTADDQEELKKTLRVAASEHAVIQYVTAEAEGELTSKTVANIDILSRPYEEVGSIEGRLELINVHRQDTIKVWDSRFHIGVICHISDMQLEDAKEYLGRRVAIRGLIRHEHERPKKVVDVFDIRGLGRPESLPRIEDIAPIDLMGSVEPADYLRGDE